MIKAEIIADSLNMFGDRCTTFVVVFPRIVLAEFNTHRALSRNSASSRAIPFEKMLKMVKENPFIPIKWMKDHHGMQGSEYLENDTFAKHAWLEARDEAVRNAENLNIRCGVTKQIANRLLEPFMWHTVIVTATEWDNFFVLRAHTAAEIHIQELAHKMLEVYNTSTPKYLEPGEWHIPFGDRIDEKRILDFYGKVHIDKESIIKDKIAIATARCARVSYLNFEGKDDYSADIKLHDNLASMGHWSPFEHCAQSMDAKQMQDLDGMSHMGNLRGFFQYRKMFEGENKIDPRIKKHND